MSAAISFNIPIGLPVSWRYAQRTSGAKLHLVRAYGDGSVDARALCGMVPSPARGNWRMTINVPLAHACRSCTRLWQLKEEPNR